jgi:hypothetical protein
VQFSFALTIKQIFKAMIHFADQNKGTHRLIIAVELPVHGQWVCDCTESLFEVVNRFFVLGDPAYRSQEKTTRFLVVKLV